MAAKAPDSFLSGLAAGFSGESVGSMAANVREHQSLNDRNVINRLREEEIINNTDSGLKIDWDKFNSPEYKSLRKSVLKSGGKALFQYYGRDGSIKQGAFDDATEVPGGVLVGTEKDDKSKGQLTDKAGEGEDEKVAVIPKNHFERTGEQILKGMYERAFPGFGAGEELKRNQVAKIGRETDRKIKYDPKFVNQRNKIQEIKDLKAGLETELAKALEDTSVEPAEARDKIITLHEEIDKADEAEQSLNEELNSFEVPSGIPARLLGEEVSEDLYNLSDSHIKSMGDMGMSGPQIEAQVARNSALIKRVEKAEFKGWVAASGDKGDVVIHSQNIAMAEAMKQKHMTDPKWNVARELQQRVEAGETLKKSDQNQLNRYLARLGAADKRIAAETLNIDEIFVKQAEGNYWGSGKYLSFFSDVKKEFSQGNKAERDYTNKERRHFHSGKMNEILADNIEETKENPLIAQIRALNVMQLAEEGNYKTMGELLRSKQYEKKAAIVDLFISEEYQKSRGAGLLSGIDMLKALENARTTGSYQIGPKELAEAEAKRLETVAGMQAEIDKHVAESTTLTKGLGTKVGTLIKSIRDKDTGEFLSATNPDFLAAANDIIIEWKAAQANAKIGGSQANSTYGAAANNAMKQVIGYGAAAALEESQPNFWSMKMFTETGRWAAAQDFYFSPLSVLPIPNMGGPISDKGSFPVVPFLRHKPETSSINAAQIGGLVDRMSAKFNREGELMGLYFKGPYGGDSSLKLGQGQAQAMYGDMYGDVMDFFKDKAEKEKKQKRKGSE
tara:strand:- start:419 stop:2779 length:2361 start_codon:yes stop_codon:yes gene_type:complete